MYNVYVLYMCHVVHVLSFVYSVVCCIMCVVCEMHWLNLDPKARLDFKSPCSHQCTAVVFIYIKQYRPPSFKYMLWWINRYILFTLNQLNERSATLNDIGKSYFSFSSIDNRPIDIPCYMHCAFVPARKRI